MSNNNILTMLFGNTSDGLINNQDFVDALFFFLAAISICNYAETQTNPDIRNDEALSLILARLDEIEKKQNQILDILKK